MSCHPQHAQRRAQLTVAVSMACVEVMPALSRKAAYADSSAAIRCSSIHHREGRSLVILVARLMLTITYAHYACLLHSL